MSRNDSLLVTGLTSASTRRYAEEQKRKAEDEARKGVQLKPHVQIIKDEIAKLKTEIAEEARLSIDPEMKPDTIKAICVGAKWAEHKLVSLEARLLKLLRAEEKS